MKHIFALVILISLLKSSELFKVHAWSKDSKIMYFVKIKKNSKASVYSVRIQSLVTDSILYKENILFKSKSFNDFISVNQKKINKLIKNYSLFEANETLKQFFPLKNNGDIYDVFHNKENLHLLSVNKGQKVIAKNISRINKLHYYKSPFQNRIAVINSFHNNNITEFRVIGASLTSNFKDHLYGKINNFNSLFKSFEYSEDSTDTYIKYNNESLNRLLYTNRIKLYKDINLYEELTLALLSKLGYKKDEVWVKDPGEILPAGESDFFYREASAGNRLNDFQINFRNFDELLDYKKLKNCLWYIERITNLTVQSKVYIQRVYKLKANFDDVAEYELPFKYDKSNKFSLSLKHDIRKICFKLSGKIERSFLDKNLIVLSYNGLKLQDTFLDLKERHVYHQFMKSLPLYYLVLDLSQLENLNNYLNKKLRVTIKTELNEKASFALRSFIPKKLNKIFKRDLNGNIYFDLKIVD